MRFRVSNGSSVAVEFDAANVQQLRQSLPLLAVAGGELHVRVGDGGWDAPIGPRGVAVRVSCDPAICARRPDDDWADIWAWCERSVEWAARLRGVARDAARDAIPPGELSDCDRRAAP